MKHVRIGDAVDVLNGYAFDSSLFNSEGRGLPVARIRDVLQGASQTYTPEDCPSTYIIDSGDLLIGMDGEFNIEFWQGGRALLNQRVCRVTGKIGVVDNLYGFLKIRERLLRVSLVFVRLRRMKIENLSETIIEIILLDHRKMLQCLVVVFGKIERLAYPKRGDHRLLSRGKTAQILAIALHCDFI